MRKVWALLCEYKYVLIWLYIDLTTPTDIQNSVIPLLMQFNKDNFIVSSATGSGKTLAYLLPSKLINML